MNTESDAKRCPLEQIPKLEKAALNLNKLFPQHFYKQKVLKKKKKKYYVVLYFW